jgi:fatty acid desaturase
MIPHREDTVFIAAAIGIAAIQFGLATANAGLMYVAPVIILLRWSHLIEHAHAHVAMTTSRLANEVLAVVLSLGTAMPLEAYRIHHVETHHRYNNGPGDWTSPFAFSGARYPDRPVALWRYMVTFIPRAWRRTIPAAIRHGGRRRRTIAVELTALGTIAIVVASISPVGFLKFYMAPWLALYLLAPWANWSHHDKCTYVTASTSSNTNLAIWNRSVGLNIGYHIAHHIAPEVHWSELSRENRARRGVDANNLLEKRRD